MHSLVMWSCCWTPGQDKGAQSQGSRVGVQSHTGKPRLEKDDSWLHKQNNKTALIFPERWARNQNRMTHPQSLTWAQRCQYTHLFLQDSCKLFFLWHCISRLQLTLELLSPCIPFTRQVSWLAGTRVISVQLKFTRVCYANFQVVTKSSFLFWKHLANFLRTKLGFFLDKDCWKKTKKTNNYTK